MELLNELDIQEHLLQYSLSYIPNPSDESDFEDTTYEMDMNYEKDKLATKTRTEQIKERTQEEREMRAQEYYNRHKDRDESLFNLPGIKFMKYTHKVISFQFHATEIDKKYIPKRRVYHVVLRYFNNRWILRRYHVPNRTKILNIYNAHQVLDDLLIDFIYILYSHMVDDVEKLVERRIEKYQQYVSGHDVNLDSDDELIFFTEEQRRARKRKENEIWKRMLPPRPKRRRIVVSDDSSDISLLSLSS